MTDWEMYAENVRRAMSLIDRAHVRSQELQREQSHAALLAFTKEIEHLKTELEILVWALEHPGQYAMDEVVDSLNVLISGKPASYRTSRHVEMREPPEE